jgi:hypothetical protein
MDVGQAVGTLEKAVVDKPSVGSVAAYKERHTQQGTPDAVAPRKTAIS